MKILDKIQQCGVIPVVVMDDASKAEPLAKALLDGGIDCVEITFRTEAAAETIQAIKRTCPQMTVGAGTVLTIEQAQQAMEAGAEFMVSPGSNEKVIRYCMEHQRCMIPGVMTPGEIEADLELGITTMKFFPAEAAGGIKMLQALSQPYWNIKFMPTGGISAENLEDYLKLSGVIACGGSWMVKQELIETESYNQITRLSKEAKEIVKKVRDGGSSWQES